MSSIGIDKKNDSHRNVINDDDVEIDMTTQSSTFSNSLINTPVSKFLSIKSILCIVSIILIISFYNYHYYYSNKP